MVKKRVVLTSFLMVLLLGVLLVQAEPKQFGSNPSVTVSVVKVSTKITPAEEGSFQEISVKQPSGKKTNALPPLVSDGSKEAKTGDEENPGANFCSGAELTPLNYLAREYIDFPTDADWFKWYLSTSGEFTAYLDVPDNRDYDIKLYSDCFSLPVIRCENGQGRDEFCTITAGGPGYVYAEVYGYNADWDSVNPYLLQGSLTQDNFDLVAGAFSVWPNNPNDQDIISIDYTVINNGPDDINSYFNQKVYIDGVFYGQCEYNTGLKAGFIGICRLSGVQLAAGNHVLKNIVDAGQNILETNEFNNERSENLVVTHSPQYDVIPGNFIVTPPNPTDHDTISITYSSKNIGLDTIPTSYVLKMYIDDVLKNVCTVPANQQPNSVYSCNFNAGMLSAGTHILKTLADADNQIVETNESNNYKEENLLVSGTLIDVEEAYRGST